jgi:flagellar protein FlbT
MAGLVLNLRPYEKFLVGGVVLQNGQRRAQIRVADTEAGVLRLSDALHPDDVKTPLTRAYFAAQSLITGDAEPAAGRRVLLSLLDDAVAGFEGFAMHPAIVAAREQAREGHNYRVLKLLRPILADEAALLISLDRGLNKDESPLTNTQPKVA